MAIRYGFVGALLICMLCNSCYRMRTSRGGGQISAVKERNVSEADILLPPGYTIDAIATGLDFPTALTLDDNGVLHVVEAGYSYGEVWKHPALVRIDQQGNKTVIARGARNGPWTGVTYHDGNFYISEGGQAEGGKILRVSHSGEVTALVENLPGLGDHHTNGLVVKDGYIYFGQGTATNSAVVGEDNFQFGWLKRNPRFHDIPCEDIILTGENFESDDILSNGKAKVLTGAYSPFGTATKPGQKIEGSVPCTGAILRIPLEGDGDVEWVAWGLRNPFGLALSHDGRMYVTENAFDERGSRPVWGAGDVLWEVKEKSWYGWPDYSEGKRIAGNDEFTPPTSDKIRPLLQSNPRTPPKPVAILGVHSSANGFDFSPGNAFGFKDQAFIALFGDMSPSVGKVLAPVGFKVVRVDIETGAVYDFIVNRGKQNGPASWLEHGGLERPVAVKFSDDGSTLYIVDYGILRMSPRPQPVEGTGVIWRVTKKSK